MNESFRIRMRGKAYMFKVSSIARICALIVACLGSTVHAEEGHLRLALARNTITAAEETFTYAVPKQLGYFSQEGLEVSILQTSGSTAALQALVSGSADVAYASSASIAAAIDKGAQLRAFAGITVQWPYFIGVPPGSPIKKISDLKGKKVGVISLASASYADLQANLKIAGLSEEDVSIVPVGAGARAAAALKSGQVDAIDSYSDSFTVMKQNGIELTLLPRPAEMNKLFSVTMVTSIKKLQEEPEQLAAFARAAYKGIIYTYRFPESALQLSFKEFPELSGSADIQSKDAQNTAEAMKIALADSIPATDVMPEKWGHWLDIPASRWDALLQFAFDTKQTEKKLDVGSIWDNRLMPEIYSFDTKAIVEKL
ncbi:ABC transporter substrate-binding protein [Microvirga sp. W0021]|uniref:ABC transporter substrate-binding protein n=1 Tax=Hohaiivirga grylli TaxID=3133970 RepID=A0ABV0BL32_9HYPH